MSKSKSKTARHRETIISATQQRTVALPLDLEPEQVELLCRVGSRYNELWGRIVRWCCSNRTVNRTRMQKELYQALRDEFSDLLSQFVCIALRDAAGAVKSWNSNHPKKRWQLKGRRKRPTICYDLRTMSVRGSLLTLSTLQGNKRLRTLLPAMPEWFASRYPDAKPNAARLVLRPKEGRATLHLVVRLDPAEAPEKVSKVLGVDLGERNLYADSEGAIFGSAQVRACKRRHAHNRKTLQEKGTRSAHRRLKAMSGREERFVSDVNHRASKRIAEDAERTGADAIAFEDLTKIRGRAQKKKGKGKRSKPTKGAGRARRMLHAWSFSQLQEYTAYKAARKGVGVVMVDPAYTSQRCSRCGHVDAASRSGGRFDCTFCGHSDHADRNAAKNVRDRALEAQQSPS